MAESITRLCDFLRNKGILTQSTTNDGNEFFGFVAEEHTGKILKHYQTRKDICELEKKNPFYFQLFLPVTALINEANLTEHLVNDLKTICRRGQSPSPREIYAASELLRRKIYICDFSGQQDDGFINCMIFVYSPIIHLEREDVHPVYLLMLDVNGVMQFSRLHFDSVNKFQELFKDSPNFTYHEHCIGRRFTNDFTKLRKDAFWCENHETKDFFRTLSLEMYGTYEYRNMVMASIFNFQVQEDYIEIFAKFLENTENSTLQQKKLAILEHQKFVREETESPDQGIIFAAVSVFNIQLLLQNYGNLCSETEFYIPLSGSYRKEFDSFLSLKEESKKMFRRSDTNWRLCLCKQEKPEVNGTLGLLKEDIYSHLKIKMPCCPSETVHGCHQHFRRIGGSKQRTEERVSYTMPINEMLRALNKLENEERTLDQIDGGHGSLYKCLAKEIFGNEDFENRHLRQLIDSDDCDGDIEEIIDSQMRSVCNWLQIPIYVFRNTHYGHHVWKNYEPSAAEVVVECRYYITIFHNISRHCFDRVIPRVGCNCQLPPPLSLRNQNTGYNEQWLLTVPKTERHKPMVEYLSEEIQDDMFETEVRDIPQCPPYSEIRLVVQRRDMRNRIIDKMEGQHFSLQRCLGKEIFGCEDRHEFVLKEICSELMDNPELFAERCKGSEEERSEFKDFFKSKSTIMKEKRLAAVRSQSEEIEDDITNKDLELEIAATRFQTEIYVLTVRNDGISEWCIYQPNIVRQIMNKSAIGSKCPERKFYVTLFLSSAGEFYRIVPSTEECNCCLRPPDIQSIEPDPHIDLPMNERRMVNTARRMENTIRNVNLVLSGWTRCNKILQELCDSMVKEIEDRRFKVNIATITGSSVGLVGAGLAVGGLILAPFTLGASTVLTIVGGAVGGVGGVTAMGAKIGESVLNVDSMHKLERYKKHFQEHSFRLEESIDNLTQTVEDFGNAVESIQLDRSLETFDKSVFQTIPGFLRAVKGFSVIPLGILRFAFRGATILGAIIGPLSALLDIGFLAFSAWNLHHGSKTDVSESLRRTSAVLLASRRQMHAWALGNKVDEDQLL